MNAREKKKRDDAIKRLCFSPKTEDGVVYRCADESRRCAEDSRRGPGLYMQMCWGLNCYTSPRFLRLLADAVEAPDKKKGKTRFLPGPARVNLVTAYYEALYRAAHAASGGRGMDVNILMSGPTVFEVKRELVRLSVPEEERPRNWYSRKGLSEHSVDHHDLRERSGFPSRQAIEKALKRLKLPRRGDRVGAPKKSQPK